MRSTQPLSSAVARFQVSADEDHVVMHLGISCAQKKLPPRAFGYMLLTLARARVADQQDGVTSAESGWLYADHLAERMRTTPEKLNVDVHRARHMIAQLGLFEDPDNIVERRQGQLRIGVENLTIERNPPR
jgi:hypothetical protein